VDKSARVSGEAKPGSKAGLWFASAESGLAVMMMMVVMVVMVVFRRIRRDTRTGENGDTQKGKHPNANLHGGSPRSCGRLLHRHQVTADYL
jgi:hypothetical protein